jgi:hypothetical protein
MSLLGDSIRSRGGTDPDWVYSTRTLQRCIPFPGPYLDGIKTDFRISVGVFTVCTPPHWSRTQGLWRSGVQGVG